MAKSAHGDLEPSHGGGHGHHTSRPYTRLGHLLQPERRDIVAVVVFAVAVAVLSLASPIAVETLVNTVAFGVLMWPVIVIALMLLACLALAGLIRAMQVYVVESLQRRLFVRVVADYAERLPRLRLEAFDRGYGPELVNRFFDILTLQKTLATLLLDGVALVVASVVGMSVLAFYHPFLLGFDVVLLFLVAFTLFGLGWGGVRTSIEESHAKYDVAAWLEEVVRCLRTFKFAAGSKFALQRADELTGDYVTARQRHFQVVWRQTVFSIGLQVVASSVLLGLGGWLVIHRQMTLGQLVAAELIVSFVVASVAKLGKYSEAYYDLLSSAEKLGLLTDLPLERQGGDEFPVGEQGLAIRIRNVSQISDRILAGLPDWNIKAGERVAIIAPPGAGKTTLFEALCGLREPQAGSVEIDGIDLRALSLEDLRDHVALVEGPDIFIGTVRQNLVIGRTEISAAEIREALKVVGLGGVVHDLPHGLDTPLTPRGGPLSAGQSVRLTIARALLGRPRLLILDGVLDSIDLRECPDLLTRLFDRSAPWTLLVATTSPKVVGMCDRILSLTGSDFAEDSMNIEEEVNR